MTKLPLALAIAVVVTLVLSIAVIAGSVVAVTAGGPFTACTVGAGTGLNYVKSEVEPFGAVNPTDPTNVIAVFQQDRWSNGGAHGLAAAVTKGGSTTVVPLPFSKCAAGTPVALQYERASDPWVSFGPGTPTDPTGATAYAVSLSFNQSPGRNGNTVAAAVSYNGGATWLHPQSLMSDAQTDVPVPAPDDNFQIFHDKESVTADPSHAGRAFVVWDVLIGPSLSVEADLHAASFQDLTLFSRTDDFGVTWSPVRTINTSAHPTQQHNQTIGNVVVVDPRNGTLYDFFDQIFNTGSNAGGNPAGAHGFNVAFQKSTDHGDTWTAPQLISPLLTAFVADPNNVDPRTNKAPAPIRTADIIPAPAIDPRTGDLYVVWQDARFSGHDEIAISRSSDGGATWSAPKRVSSPVGAPAFTASVAVLANGTAATSTTAAVAGTVGVTYYQFGATSSGKEPTSYLIKTFSGATVSSPSASNLESLSPTTVAGPFNMLDAPFARGYFVGDYEALATVGADTTAHFVPIFVQGACGASLSCRALTQVFAPADRTPTGSDSTNVFVGSGF